MRPFSILLQVSLTAMMMASCIGSSGGEDARPLNVNALAAQVFRVDPGRDTVLYTAGGAVLRIPRGVLKSKVSPAAIEVREAFTFQQMIVAGLTTQSGDEPLSSGGMIYINGAGEQELEIRGSIAVSVPADRIEIGMRRYRGVEQPDGSIDWRDPQPLSADAGTKRIAEGRSLFENNCTTCHGLKRQLTGPALIRMQERRSWDWLKNFTRNPAKMIAGGDRLANCVYIENGMTMMTAFPNLTDDELKNLYDYIDSATADVPFSLITTPSQSCMDSCERFEAEKAALQEERRRLIGGNEDAVITKVVPPGNATATPAVPAGDSLVIPDTRRGTYYQFNVTATGWYNIDILVKNVTGAQNSELMVRIQGSYRADASIFLALPEEKIFVEGGKLEGRGDDMYGFYRNDGTLPLVLNRRGYILAIGESGDGQFVFASQEFRTKNTQTIAIVPGRSTRSQLDTAIRKMGLPDVSIDIGASRNKKELIQVDAALQNVERLKPRGCDCNCGRPLI